MYLGIDFGTTRTMVAYADRGNYPVVSFADSHGDYHEYFPSVAALVDGQLKYGFAALEAQANGATLLRSFKRALADPEVNAASTITCGGAEFRLLDVLTGYLSALNAALRDESTAAAGVADDDCAVIAVPAHANSAQRFLTLEAFRRAGFRVGAMLNEPSAAGFEFTHRQAKARTAKRTRVLVYDLGGGTFDASLVAVDGVDHHVIDSVGINRLGGDDFDEVLAECASAALGGRAAVQSWPDLVDQAREAKERLSGQTRRLALEINGDDVLISVEEFYAAAAGLVDNSMTVMQSLVDGLDTGNLPGDVAGIYLVGGASSLPLVLRMLRARFGRRVHRSPYPGASTAIGLAIATGGGEGYSLTDRLSRGFGVFREGGSGATVQFDPILAPDTEVIPGVDHRLRRRYRAAHNVGHFRYVEYRRLGDDGQPRGSISPFAQVHFPFDANLRGCSALADVPVQRCFPGPDQGPEIEESYTVDSNGIVRLRILNLNDGYQQDIRLG